MKLGLAMPQAGAHVTTRVVREFATRAERLGFDSLWVQDHLLYPREPVNQPPGSGAWPEAYREIMAPLELLAYIGAITERIRLGTAVLVTAYHRPVALAKQAATIDVLTNGRLMIGLGLGWSKDEYQVMETPFEQRGERSGDFIRALRACWAPNPVSHDGPFFKVPLSDTSPKPVQRDARGNAAIPLVGGFWADAGLRRVAETCDYWQSAGHEVDEAVAMSAKINQIARDAFGRDPLPLMMHLFAFPQLPGMAPRPPSCRAPNWSGTAADMMPGVLAAKAAGVSELVLDTCFFYDNPGEDGWIAQPEFFAPLLEEAHR